MLKSPGLGAVFAPPPPPIPPVPIPIPIPMAPAPPAPPPMVLVSMNALVIGSIMGAPLGGICWAGLTSAGGGAGVGMRIGEGLMGSGSFASNGFAGAGVGVSGATMGLMGVRDGA